MTFVMPVLKDGSWDLTVMVEEDLMENFENGEKGTQRVKILRFDFIATPHHLRCQDP